MHLASSIRALLLAALGLGTGASVASAADITPMPVKAPPPPLDQFDVHGYFDMAYKNAYVTGNGRLV